MQLTSAEPAAEAEDTELPKSSGTITKLELIKDAIWTDSPGRGGTLYFKDEMKLHIKDQETWEKWKTDAARHVPFCILNYLRRASGDDMELHRPDERYKVGETVSVENISTDGARILVTKAELEFAFANPCCRAQRVWHAALKLQCWRAAVLQCCHAAVMPAVMP